MKFLKIIFVFFAAIILTGCLSMPPLIVEGPNLQLITNGVPFYEAVHSSKDECEKHAINSINNMGFETKKQIEKGSFKVICSGNSAKNLLKYAGHTIDIITNKKVIVRFVSKNACLLAKNTYEKNFPSPTVTNYCE